MSADPLAGALDALTDGRWAEARAGLEQAVAADETAEAVFGLATALWWMGENRASVERCSRAYALYRAAGEVEGSARCAVWLAMTYKANFANYPAANGWLGRAERLLAPLAEGPLHGRVWVARAYRMADLETAEALSRRAADVAYDAGDVDLELVALSQLGLVRVAKGDTMGGFGLIDEAVAAALAGERSTLDTVVYACCDMLNACELASDLDRAAEWSRVADEFVDRYGCPFLYAECRIYYGSVLAARGRWGDADRELDVGARITEDACPGLHRRALGRLAGLRVRQGRLEEAEALLAELPASTGDDAVEATLHAAALALARGDAGLAARLAERHLDRLGRHPLRLAEALGLLVEASVASGRDAAAADAADRLVSLASRSENRHLEAAAAAARGRVLAARGAPAAAAQLEEAVTLWSTAERPLEAARARLELARALLAGDGEAALGHAREALAGFEALGASLDADRAAAFLRSQGVVARTGPKGTGLLTVREREVLALVGLGLSNPEIAVRLHISRKTAAHHVSSILAKLGLRNRAEAAARAGAVAGPSGAEPR